MFPYREYSLTFNPNVETVQPRVRAVAGDEISFALNILFINVDLTDITVKLFILKPDNSYTSQTVDIVGEGIQGKARILVGSLDIAGIYQGAISLHGTDGQRLSFTEFPIVVEAPVGG